MHPATARHDSPPPERLVGIPEIVARTGLERTTIYRLQRAGKFPTLRKRGDRRVFVLESELVAWMRGDQ
jgi:prophage regulatory protein